MSHKNRYIQPCQERQAGDPPPFEIGAKARAKVSHPLMKELRDLTEKLRVLIERVERLGPSPERDASVHELDRYRASLNAFVERHAITLH
jgi:hypothetical protein